MSQTTSSVYSEQSLFEVSSRKTHSKRRSPRQYSPRFDRKRRGGSRAGARSANRQLNQFAS